MIYATQAKMIADQDDFNYMVELYCEDIDAAIRHAAARHEKELVTFVDPSVIDLVSDILKHHGFAVSRMSDMLDNGCYLKIEWRRG